MKALSEFELRSKASGKPRASCRVCMQKLRRDYRSSKRGLQKKREQFARTQKRRDWSPCACGCSTLSQTEYTRGHHPNSTRRKYDDGLTAGQRYHKRLREDALTAYGNACACCEENCVAFLVIDHVNGDGAAHRRVLKPVPSRSGKAMGGGSATYKWLRENKYPKGFQVLCANCNMAKERPGGCPHQGADYSKWGEH